MPQNVTYIKCNAISAIVTSPATVYREVVELGLAINEAARILGAFLNLILPESIPTYALGRIAYNFDPEETLIGMHLDEQFAGMEVMSNIITSGGGLQTHSQFFDFSGMNVITSRDITFLAYSESSTPTDVIGCNGKLYYEKYIPSDKDLIQLIAQRR